MREWLSGRASPCQGERREFESRLPLHKKQSIKSVAFFFAKKQTVFVLKGYENGERGSLGNGHERRRTDTGSDYWCSGKNFFF